ncbi:MAG: RNase adapter RapZ [Pseudomonadota bacterium]
MAGEGAPPRPAASARPAGSTAAVATAPDTRPRPAPRRSEALVLVTGLSGAGRTTAINALEDLGYEAINNFPLSLVPALVAEPAGHEGGAREGGDRPLALGLESRTRGFSAERLAGLLVSLRATGEHARVVLVFLDCSDGALARRFSETRRRHPLAPAEDVETGIRRERDLMRPVRADADLVIDTTALSPHELKREIALRFAPAPAPGDSAADGPSGAAGRGLAVTVNSFSYRRGVPQGCDVVIDVRFLRNPYWQETLRPLDGRDVTVQSYVAGDRRYEAFFEQLTALLLLLLPAYAEEGKVYFSVALGCTGGRHRSVTVAERLAVALEGAGWPAGVRHRELERLAPGEGGGEGGGVGGGGGRGAAPVATGGDRTTAAPSGEQG